MRIILVRHGSTEWNDKDVFRGRVDISLDKIGIQQAYAIANRLSVLDVSAVYSSPLKRALETAQIIATKLKVNIKAEDSLVDFDFGKWQGLSTREVQKQFPQAYKQWLSEPHLVKIPGAENLSDVRNRITKMLFETLIKEKNDIVVVSHRIVNKMLICAALSLDDSYFWQIKQDVAAISILDYRDGVFTLSLLNDTNHLGGTEQLRDF